MNKNHLTADVTFNPYTLLLIDDQKDGELRFRFNNYLVDKNEIWEGYDVNSTPHWNSDADTQMYEYLMNDYIPDSETKDDIYRNAVIRLRGLANEPELIMEKELVNLDGTKQCEAPKITWNPEKGEYIIELKGNGWQEFRLALNKSGENVDKAKLKEWIDRANGLDQAEYTKESFEVMKNALVSAQEVYANEQASEVEVKTAEENLRKAIDALVIADLSGTEKPDAGTDNGQKPDGNNGSGGASDTTGNQDNTNSTPKTGDTASAGILIAMFVALAAVSTVIRGRKKMK